MNFSVHFDFAFRRAEWIWRNLALLAGFGGGAPFWRGAARGQIWLQKSPGSMLPGQIEMGSILRAIFGWALSGADGRNLPAQPHLLHFDRFGPGGGHFAKKPEKIGLK
jgi:hypothetical protein